MLERYADRARQIVVLAQEQARELKHPDIGPEHLLLGFAIVGSLPVHPERLRAKLLEISPPGPVPAQLPMREETIEVLSDAEARAAAANSTYVEPAHLLASLLDERCSASRVVLQLGVNADELRAQLAQGVGELSAPQAVHDHLAAGDAVPVTLGFGLPVGDLGNPRTDGRLLLSILAAAGPAAQLLRAHGVDEDRLRQLA
jgi:ATP-dependent Clp protease ATP-binding subunit ClpC